MKFIGSIILNIYFFFASKEKAFRLQLLTALRRLRDGLANESKETKVMLETYYRFTQGEASKEEMEKANEQFRDLLRAMGLGIFAVLPFAPITIPFVVKIGEKLGINILPSSFRDPD